MAINFYTEDITFNLKNKSAVKQWLKAAITEEGYKLKELNFIFCSDAYLLRLNQQYLNHDTYTDVITFDNAEAPKTIVGDIFISVERTSENAAKLGIDPVAELKRVMVHGTLHLLGYKDKRRDEKALMTSKEDYYLIKS